MSKTLLFLDYYKYIFVFKPFRSILYSVGLVLFFITLSPAINDLRDGNTYTVVIGSATIFLFFADLLLTLRSLLGFWESDNVLVKQNAEIEKEYQKVPDVHAHGITNNGIFWHEYYWKRDSINQFLRRSPGIQVVISKEYARLIKNILQENPEEIKRFLFS
ncbi:MAG TPA: hypothetical protein P5550_10945 [Bacteroidales bacterium]|nr:hypothetical protein [Bacteroidales bacterium]HRZ76531.1 hypothetical protein [Bacteroidales bacterium]